MTSKRKLTILGSMSIVMGLVVAPLFAGGYRPTPEGPNRWEYRRQEPYREEAPKAQAVETPAAGENLIDSTYKAVTGTAGAAGQAVLDTADAAGKALAEGAETGGKTLGDAADAVTGTATAAYRTVAGEEKPVEKVHVEEIAIEQPKEKGLFRASWDAITGTADAIGRTFGAVYASVFPVKEGEAEIEQAEPEKPQTRRYRFVPRYHGMVARRVAY